MKGSKGSALATRGWFALVIAVAFANPASAEDLRPTFTVHFAVITRNPAAHRVASLEQLKKEVGILNTYFVSEQRRPLVTFVFKSAALYDELKGSSCELVGFGDRNRPFDSVRAVQLLNACDDPRVRDPHAINFYVYDASAHAPAVADATSHGRRNSNRPFVLVDWRRLNHGDQGAEEHEMGHAFGLSHECAPGAAPTTSTNIMTSAECGRGSGGRRDIGFNERQVKTILMFAPLISQSLRPLPP